MFRSKGKMKGFDDSNPGIRPSTCVSYANLAFELVCFIAVAVIYRHSYLV